MSGSTPPIHALTRRDFLAGSAALIGSASLARPRALAASGPEGGAVRNVILIVSDTLRRDALGCYGSTWVKTPHLDKFSGKSVVLDQAYVSSFPTVPCRNDVLTGRYTFTYKPWAPIDPDAVTLQETLARAGIRTALIADTRHPFAGEMNYQRGFEATHLIRGQEGEKFKSEPAEPKFPCDVNKLRSGPRVVTNYLRNVHDRRGEEDYFVAQTMRAAADWLRGRKTHDPFFLYVDTFDPHEPWDPPRQYVDRYDPGYTGQEVIYPRYDRWRDFLTEAELKHCRALYAAEVSLVDRWIGHLIETVETLGLLGDTLVIVASDHGFLLGEHGFIGKLCIRDSGRQSLPLYPEISRIPMILSYPGGRPGTRLNLLAQPVNLMPTILEFLGVPIPDQVQSPSLTAALQGRADPAAVRIVVSSPTLSHARLRTPDPADRSSICDGRWMLVYGAQTDRVGRRRQTTTVPADESPPTPELYDLDADPACGRNLYAARYEVARGLHVSYVGLLEKCRMNETHLRFFRKLPDPAAKE
ncbi:MAG: sulfatase [Planctomycetes bacterium]|nr:sulfatase [Planctomycetota bacterium]